MRTTVVQRIARACVYLGDAARRACTSGRSLRVGSRGTCQPIESSTLSLRKDNLSRKVHEIPTNLQVTECVRWGPPEPPPQFNVIATATPRPDAAVVPMNIPPLRSSLRIS